jgi:hypothetical protein
VAYRIHDLKLESSSDTEDVYRVTKWEPFEVSIVSVPADPTVGVGRSLQSAVPQPQEKQMEPAATVVAAAAAAVDTSKIIADARQAELERGREINAIGAQFKCSAEAEAAISAGKSVDEFRKEVLGRVHADAVKRAKDASHHRPHRRRSEALLVRAPDARARESGRPRAQEPPRTSVKCRKRPGEEGKRPHGARLHGAARRARGADARSAT